MGFKARCFKARCYRTTNDQRMDSEHCDQITSYYPQVRDTSITYDRETDALRSGEFPRVLILKVDGSEPRDVLQLEMTCLSYMHLSTTLFVLAAAVALDIKFPSRGDAPWHGFLGKFPTSFLLFISFTLILLSIFILVVSGLHYIWTIERYAQHLIRLRSWVYIIRLVSMTSIILILMGINISLIIDSQINPVMVHN